MRKLKLLLAACALFVGAGTSWAAQTPEAGGVYYLYNEATGLFMSRGATWGTRALADNYGVPIKLTLTDGKYTLTAVDRNTNGYGGQWWMYSDESTAANRPMTFTAAADDNYKLKVSLWGDDNQFVYINATGEGGYTNLLAGNSKDQAGLAEGMYLWKFLSQAERDEIIAAKVEEGNISIASKIGYTVASTTELETLIGDNNSFAATSYTSSISSASLENSTSGWTYNKEANRNKNLASNGNGTECFEGCGTLTQTVSGLKQGLYKVTINGFHRSGANTACYTREHTDGLKAISQAYIDANGYRAQIKSWASDATSNTAPNNMGDAKALFNVGKYLTTVYTYVDNDGKLDLTIGFPAYNESGWYIFDNVTLTYYSDAVSDEDATAILEEANNCDGKIMQASLQTALTSAKNTFEGSKTIANYNALSTAVTEAQASVTAYANVKAYLDRINGYLTGENTFTNFYTTDAYNTTYANIKTKYDARTLTTAETSGLTAESAYQSGTAWHAANYIDDIMLSTWTVNGNQCKDYDNYSERLYVNTWSIEGNTDGSEFYAPFYEYWVSSGNTLAARTFTSTITGLTPNETYSVTIRARVQPTDNKTMIDNAILMKVGEGEAVCISNGAKFGSTNYYIGNFSAVGQTDAEGKLVTTITVADASNVSWLSFYNVRYTEGEDLSAYIADYQFALNTATANSTNTAYAAITGKERADLEAALVTYATVDNTDKAALIAAKEALETVSNTFVAATTTYTTFAELNKNVATKLGVSLPTITNATVAADLDVESYIVDEYTAAKAYAQNYTDKLGTWTNAPGTNKGESWDGTSEDTYYDLYNAAACTMSQTVTLPAGDYALIAKGRASVNGKLTLTVGDETITYAHKSSVGRGIATDGTATFADGETYANTTGRGWEYRVMTFTSDGETATTLTFNWTTASNNWVGLDDIELLCNPAALDYSALQAAYDAVSIPTLGFENAEYAPYNNVENLNNITAAKNMLDAQDATSQSEINAVKDAITGMTWKANDGEQSAIKLTASYDADSKDGDNRLFAAGWDKAGRDDAYNTRLIKGSASGAGMAAADEELALFTKFGTKYGEEEGYTMPLKAATVYKLSFKFGAWGENKEIVSRLAIADANGNPVAIIPASFTRANNSGLANESTEAWFDYTGYFKTNGAGNYVLTLTKDNNGEQRQIVMANIDLKKAVAEDITIAETADYTPAAKYANVTFQRTLVEGWNGLVLPFDMTAAEVETTFNASKVKTFDGITFDSEKGVTLNFADATELKAGQPFLVKAAAGTSYTINGVILSADALQNITKTNATAEYTMKGTYAATTNLTDVSFALIQGTKYFYHTAGVNSSSAKAFRAYFENNSTDPDAARVTFNLDDEVATGISEISGKTNQTAGTIYDLQGRKVENAKKGLYIRDGKKMFKN